MKNWKLYLILAFNLICLFSFLSCFAKLKMINFSFKDKKLIEIIDDLASKKKINILYPENQAELEDFKKQVITYLPKKNIKISFDEAWNILKMYLEMSGYSLYKRNNNLFAITKTGTTSQAGISREILPLYVDSKIEDLPNSAQRIIYVSYLKNLKVPKESEIKNSPINQIISDMSSKGSIKPIYMQGSNGFIICDQANVVSSIINIIQKIDQTGLRQVIEILPIYHLAAQEVAKIFQTLKKAAGQEQNIPFIRYDPNESARTYFSSDTQIIANDIDNSLILMGAEASVNKIKDFISKNLDKPLDAGSSILHIYELNFLDAKTFAPILQEIVNPINISSGDQATQNLSSGVNRYFEGVVIVSEELVKVKTKDDTEKIRNIDLSGTTPIYKDDKDIEIKGITGDKFIGGNRLVIAALEDDWLELEPLIKRLDKPEPQVILQAMIVDFRGVRDKTIASTIRNKTSFDQPNSGVQFFASHITPSLQAISNRAQQNTDNTYNATNFILGNTPQQLAQDLLALTGSQSLPAVIDKGSTLISFNDRQTPGIFGLLQILSDYVNFNILSMPSVLTLNNAKGVISQEFIKRVQGDATIVENQNFEVIIEDLKQILKLEFVPQIGSINKVKLSVKIDIEDFVSEASLTRLTKNLNTTATLTDGQILVVGGLVREDENDNNTYTPILGKIPLIGAFFRKTSKSNIKNNILIFIQPTIIFPKNYEGLKKYTQDKFSEIYDDTDSNYLIDLKDPIDRAFFKNDRVARNNLELEYFESNQEISKSSLLSIINKPNNKKDYNNIKKLIACEKNPISGIKLAQSKKILNC